jgi:hypothetical protein
MAKGEVGEVASKTATLKLTFVKINVRRSDPGSFLRAYF